MTSLATISAAFARDVETADEDSAFDFLNGASYDFVPLPGEGVETALEAHEQPLWPSCPTQRSRAVLVPADDQPVVLGPQEILLRLNMPATAGLAALRFAKVVDDVFSGTQGNADLAVLTLLVARAAKKLDNVVRHCDEN